MTHREVPVGCKGFGIDTVLVGLDRVGVVGLRDAFESAERSGRVDREAMLDLLMEILQADNYVPDAQNEAFRTAVWREYLRYKGQDFRDFLSEVEVVIRGDAGHDRDRFVEMTHEVLRTFELKPVPRFEPASPEGPNPQLVINDDAVVRGMQTHASFKTAVRKSISHW
jgi:hypothetical protein